MYIVVTCNWNMLIGVSQNNVEFLYVMLTNEINDPLICLINPSGIFLGNSMGIAASIRPMSLWAAMLTMQNKRFHDFQECPSMSFRSECLLKRKHLSLYGFVRGLSPFEAVDRYIKKKSCRDSCICLCNRNRFITWHNIFHTNERFTCYVDNFAYALSDSLTRNPYQNSQMINRISGKSQTKDNQLIVFVYYERHPGLSGIWLFGRQHAQPQRKKRS